MDLVHLECEDPRWPEALTRLRHDSTTGRNTCGLTATGVGRPRAFLAKSGDKELFIPYLLRRCDASSRRSAPTCATSFRPTGIPVFC